MISDIATQFKGYFILFDGMTIVPYNILKPLKKYIYMYIDLHVY